MKLTAFLALTIACFVCVALADDDARSIVLVTKDAKIEGSGAVYDDTPDYRCIRHWGSTNVIARWKFELAAKGAYRVFVTYACPPQLAGSDIVVTAGTQRANGTTESTGRWTVFKEFDLGPILIRKPGTVELSVQATRKVGVDVWDFRSVRLMKED